MEQRKFVKKVCLLGDGAVGKTSLIRRYILNLFDDRYVVSFGTKVTKKVLMLDDLEMTLSIWDILGQKAHTKLHEAYYRGASAAFLVCDRTRPETIESLSEWAESFRKVNPSGVMHMLANKSDLPSVVTGNSIAEMAAKLSVGFDETSAKTGQNVEKAFEEISRKIMGDAS